MSSTFASTPGVPPAASLHDVAHPAAASVTPAPSFPPVAAPVAPVIQLRDVTHAPAAAAELAQEYGPVTASEPLPVPLPAGVTRSQLTAEPQRVVQKPSMITGIVPETALYKPEPQKKVAPAPATPAPAAAPVATVELHDASPIAGGPVAAPLVPLPQGTPNAAVDTPFAVADSVRQLAGRHGIDLGTVTPTGKGGRITKKDVESAIAAAAMAEASAAVTNTEAAPTVTVPATAVVTAPATGSPALADGDDEDDDKPLTVVVHTPPRETDSAPVAAPAPAAAAAPAPAPAPAAAPAPAPTAAPAPAPAPVTEIATLRARLDLSSGNTFQIGSSDDLLNLASEKLPLFRVIAAVLEFSTKGPVLVATVDSNLEVSL